MQRLFFDRKGFQGGKSFGLGRIVAIALTLALLLLFQAPSLSQAPELNQLEAQQQQVNQKQQALEAAKQRLRAAQTEAQGNLLDLQQGLQSTDSQLQDNQAQIEQSQRFLKSLEGQLSQAQQRFEQQRSATVARLQVLQRQPKLQGWAGLLQSDSLIQLLERQYQLEKLFERDRAQLNAITTQATEVEARRETIAEQKNGIALLRQKLLSQKATLQQKKQSQETLAQLLKQNEAAIAAAQDQLQKDSASLTLLIQQKLAERAAANVGIPGLGQGPFRLPAVGPMSSDFGWRIHPVLGTERFHGGLDFAIDYDSPVTATAPGVVIYADWYGGYGYAVIIDHGNGITSLYGHNNELRVAEGQIVQAGQLVALSGSTGLSTGPHLHFEVRENGEPVDPKGYL
ncbi:MAG: peptidoglycan DD-metalloendopeptidase family protein [Synechococcales cyanobacterium RM1_1_8]|nr:peptidoglycan DD-metalloendopeptidase family protein [Synechococcales cyanobacterium RM1_1_8]